MKPTHWLSSDLTKGQVPGHSVFRPQDAECMADARSNWCLETSLASRLGAHVGILEQVVSRLNAEGWCEKEVFGIQLALEESLTNAVKHGNKEDESKCVHIHCEISPSRFWAHICDEGDGFRPGEVPDPTNEENLTAVGGRGLLLIKSYMTNVCYNASGNCVTLLKVRGRGPNCCTVPSRAARKA